MSILEEHYLRNFPGSPVVKSPPSGVGGGREVQEEGDICVPIADSWQKPTQYCKAIVLQLKTNKFLKRQINLYKIRESAIYCRGGGGGFNPWLRN